MNIRYDYNKLERVEVIVKKDLKNPITGEPTLYRTLGIKWCIDGEYFGFWRADWNLEKLAFQLWFHLLLNRILGKRSKV